MDATTKEIENLKKKAGSGGKFRKKGNPFIQVPRELYTNQLLSHGGIVLYGIILSFIDIPGWDLYKSHISSIFNKNEKTFDKYWKELKANGYLAQYKVRASSGQFEYVYELLESSDVQHCEKIHNLVYEENAYGELIPIAQRIEGNTPVVTGVKSGVQTTPPKIDPVEVSGGGKLGGYINKEYIYNNNININKNLLLQDEEEEPTTFIINQNGEREPISLKELTKNIEQEYAYTNKIGRKLSDGMLNYLIKLCNVWEWDLIIVLIELSSCADNPRAYIQAIVRQWTSTGVKTFDDYYELNNPVI